jgi:hypothetical protein
MKINIYYVPLFVLSFFYFIWSNELKYFIYLFTILFFVTFYDKIEFNENFYKFNNFLYVLFISFLVIAAYEVSLNIYFLEIINSNFLKSLNYVEEIVEVSNSRRRYSYFNLDANYASILMLMIYNLLFFKRQKNYLFKITMFTFILLFFTQSKSGLLFYFINLISYRFNFSFKRQIIIFFVLNLIIFISSYVFYKNFKNPYKEKNKYYVQQIYYEEVCNNENFDKLKVFTDCEKRNQIIFGLFGYSSYLKFYSIGFVINNIYKNFDKYLLPNVLKNMSEQMGYTNHILNNNFSAHNLILKGVIFMGLLFFSFFLIGIYILFKRQNNYNLLPAMVAGSFVGIDIFLFLPIILMSSYELKK